MNRFFTLWVILLMTLSATAQQRQITGNVEDRDNGDPIPQVTVQLLRTDSTFVAGALSGDNGLFTLQAPADGRYILRFSSVGYTLLHKDISVKDSANVSLGRVVLGADAIMLRNTTVTAQAARVTVVEDTVIYNAAAYRTPEGSVVEELVKKLPGAEVSDDGTITINGKTVKKVKVDGKEFMTGDTKVAMKNLPTSIVDKVKTYDEKSDLARITGIDDGEESTVLDFGLKEGMHRGTFGNVDAGVGTKHRYAERLMGSYMNQKTRLMAFGNANNVGDRGFPGGGGGGRFGGGQEGLNASKMVGINFNNESGQKRGGRGEALEIDGSVLWNHSDSDRRSFSSTENFVTTAGSFSNSQNQNYSRQNSLQGQFRLEWEPDTLWNINMRVNANYSTNDSNTASQSASYNHDPYEYPGIVNPLMQQDELERIDSMMVNARQNQSVSYSDRLSLNGSIQVNRKLNAYGRNVTLRVEAGKNDQDSKNISENSVALYQISNFMNTGDSTYITRRYNLTPTDSRNYTLQATYSEPLTRRMFLQFNYRFQYRYNKSDRSTYDFSSNNRLMDGTPFGAGQTGSFFDRHSGKYGGWDTYFDQLDHPLGHYLSDSLSRFSEYTNYIHDLRLTLRVIQEKYRLNLGVLVQPQRTHFVQHYYGYNADTVRTVMNVAPTMDFRYRWNRQKQLRVEYQGSSSQPSMTDLLDITDDSDPLNVSTGNPGLKPSFSHRFNLRFNNFIQSHTRFINANASWSATQNSISTLVTYNPQTGGRITRPENINGNWNASAGLTYNLSIDSTGVWNVSTATNYNFNHYVSYVTLSRNASSQRNTTYSSSLTERLSLSFRKDWIEVTLDGSGTYNHTRNLLQATGNQDTWRFNYGGSLNIYAPWGMSLSTDIHNQSRRGYTDETLNTDELIWNAQISQGFLKGKPLTVMLQFYDILHEMSNFSRNINAMRRNDTSYNSINSYAMLHVVYRMNLFGSREARRGMRGGMDFRRGGSDRFEGGPDRFGGGRPDRFGGGGGGGRRPGGGGRF